MSGARASAFPMIEMARAFEIVRDATAGRRECELVDLWKPEVAVGAVLAEQVTAPRNVPPTPCSRVDGYALHASDGPGLFRVTARHRPGDGSEPTAPGGGAGGLRATAWVTTGGAVPAWADAVVPVEDTRAASSDGAAPPPGAEAEVEVEVLRAAQPGENVRPAGSDVAAGQALLPAGHTLQAGDCAALLSCGLAAAPVWRRPVVGILSSGDELVDAAAAAGSGGRVVDVNRPMLKALLRGCARVVDLGAVADSEAAVEAALLAAASSTGGGGSGGGGCCDAVVTTGGVSMGDRDFLKPLLGRLGRVLFGRLNMKPGKPTTLALLPRGGPGGGSGGGDVVVFALPGNPVSAWVTAHMLVVPGLRHMAGAPWAAALPPLVHVRLLDEGLQLDRERPEFHRATVWAAGGNGSGLLEARSTGNQASSRLLSLADANALLRLPAASSPEAAAVVTAAEPSPPLVPAYLVGPVLALDAVPAAVRARGRAGASGGGGGGGDCACGRVQAPPAAAASATATAAIPPAATKPAPPAAHVTEHARVAVSLCVLTVSDRCARGEAEDVSGPTVVRILTAAPRLDVRLVEVRVVPDDEAAIRGAVAAWASPHQQGPHGGRGSAGPLAATPPVATLVVTTGGTGFGRRDVTPEALRPLIRRPAPGLVHAMLALGSARTPLAALSRYEAGVVGDRTLLVELPGSAKAVAECLEALVPLLPHALALLLE